MHECEWDDFGRCTVGGCEHPMVRLYREDVEELRAENARLRAEVEHLIYVVVRVTPDSQEPRGVYTNREDAEQAAQDEADGRFTSGEVYEFDVR